MIEEEQDEEILEELRKDEEKQDFNSIINRKKVNKWEMDQAFLGEA